MPKPMKFKTADLRDTDVYVRTDGWLGQAKIDGVRALIRLDELGNVEVISSNGSPLKSAVAGPVVRRIHALLDGEGANFRNDLLDHLPRTVHLDGEILGDTFWLFDMVVDGYEKSGYARRYETLESLYPVVEEYLPGVTQLLPLARTAEEKRSLIDRLYRDGGEGVMMKYRDSAYVWGGRISDTVKLKFVSDVDVVVMRYSVGSSAKVKTDGVVTPKDNVEVGLYRDGVLVPVANCSTIGKPIVEVGEVLTVTYLYAGAGDRLVQPTIKTARDDKPAEECTWDQLRFVNKSVALDVL